MNRETRFTIRDGVMFNRVADETVLLDLDKGTYLGLDPVGTRFWPSTRWSRTCWPRTSTACWAICSATSW